SLFSVGSRELATARFLASCTQNSEGVEGGRVRRDQGWAAFCRTLSLQGGKGNSTIFPREILLCARYAYLSLRHHGRSFQKLPQSPYGDTCLVSRPRSSHLLYVPKLYARCGHWILRVGLPFRVSSLA